MKYCKRCKVKLADQNTKCPICLGAIEVVKDNKPLYCERCEVSYESKYKECPICKGKLVNTDPSNRDASIITNMLWQ